MDDKIHLHFSLDNKRGAFMKKIIKLISLILSLLVLFAFAGCDQGNDLAAYKADAKAGLESYAEESGYTPDNWEVVLGLVADGKVEIDAAADKPAVDTAVEKAEQAIDDVPQKEEEMDIVSIHFVVTKLFGGNQNHKFYNFTEMTFSTKNQYLVPDDWDGEHEEYVVTATFTKEKADAFFKTIKELGILDLEEYYPNTEGILDGSAWDLTISFSDGSVFESGGENNFPEMLKALDEAILLLTGYELF